MRVEFQNGMQQRKREEVLRIQLGAYSICVATGFEPCVLVGVKLG